MRPKGNKNKKTAMAHITLRVPKGVLIYFKKTYGRGFTKKMREVLANYIS